MDGIDLVQEICISGLDFSLLNPVLRAWLRSDEQAGFLYSTLLYSSEVYLCILPENTQGINNFSFLWFESLSVGSGSNSRE